MMILENRQFIEQKDPSPPIGPLWKRLAIGGWLVLMNAGQLHGEGPTPVSARFASINGVVMVSTTAGGEELAQKGDSVRAGTVITSSLKAGALLRPLPSLSLVIYPESKVRYEGAGMTKDGGGNMSCSILSGKALFHLDDSNSPRIEVKAVTEEGIVMNRAEAHPSGKQPKHVGAGAKSDPATWTVQHDEGRTVVAVSEGTTDVTIGQGGAAVGGDIGGQIEVPKGSVIWLFNRGGGRIDAELVDTISGKITNLTGGRSQGGDLLTLSRKQIIAPSSAGTTSTLGTTPSGTTIPTAPPSNPDLSSPRTPLPVVSSDTP